MKRVPKFYANNGKFPRMSDITLRNGPFDSNAGRNVKGSIKEKSSGS